MADNAKKINWYKVFVPFISTTGDSEKEPLLYMEYNGYKATGKRTSDGFVVLKGSQINPAIAKACPKRALKDRNRYETYIDAESRLTADVLLSSPSAAASFVGGASLSGNFKWKDENGTTLGQLEGTDKSNWTITLYENDTPQIEQYPSVRTICPGEGCREHPKKQKCRCGIDSVAAAFLCPDSEKALKSRAFGKNEKVGNFYQNYLPFMATVDNNDTVSQSFI